MGSSPTPGSMISGVSAWNPLSRINLKNKKGHNSPFSEMSNDFTYSPFSLSVPPGTDFRDSISAVPGGSRAILGSLLETERGFLLMKNLWASGVVSHRSSSPWLSFSSKHLGWMMLEWLHRELLLQGRQQEEKAFEGCWYWAWDPEKRISNETKSIPPSCKLPMSMWAQLGKYHGSQRVSSCRQPCRFPGSPPSSVTVSVTISGSCGCPSSCLSLSFSAHRAQPSFLSETGPVSPHFSYLQVWWSLQQAFSTWPSSLLVGNPSDFLICLFSRLFRTLHFCLSPIPSLLPPLPPLWPFISISPPNILSPSSAALKLTELPMDQVLFYITHVYLCAQLHTYTHLHFPRVKKGHLGGIASQASLGFN